MISQCGIEKLSQLTPPPDRVEQTDWANLRIPRPQIEFVYSFEPLPTHVRPMERPTRRSPFAARSAQGNNASMHSGFSLFLFLSAMCAVDLVAAYSPWRPFSLLRLSKDDDQLERIEEKRSASAFDGYDKRMQGDRSGYGWDQCEFSPLSCLLRRRRSVRPQGIDIRLQPSANESRLRTLLLMHLIRG